MAKRKPKPKKQAKKRGRPTQYKPEYCQKLIDHMKKGYSYDVFAVEVKVCRKTLYLWEERYPEWVKAKEQAVLEGQMFWERTGILGTLGKIPNFNVGGWVFNMKNRFRWRDRHEISGDPSHPLTVVKEKTTVAAIVADLSRMTPAQIDERIKEISQQKLVGDGE